MMIADSDVLIDFLRGRAPTADRIRIEIATGRLATTAINAFELASGTRTASEHDKVTTLLSALTILPVEEDAAARAADTRRDLEKQGRGIGMADYLIAGVCLSHGATLLTRNRDHFGRVPNLRLSGVLSATW